MTDTSAPTLLSAATSSDGAQVTLTYDEPLRATYPPPTTAFNISVNGSAASVSQVTIRGTDVHLGLTASILPEQSASVSYIVPTDDTLREPIQDITGNNAASLSLTPVTNNSTVANNSDLDFSTSTVLARTGYTLEGITAADFNNDGLADLAITDANSVVTLGIYSVKIYLGNGSGAFRAGGTQTVGDDPGPITANDFNGDGKIDAAVANEGSSTISILLGDGSGNLSEDLSPLLAGESISGVIGTTAFARAAKPRFIVNGDFNGDGKADLAWTNYYKPFSSTTFAGTIGIAINNGTATPFSTVTTTIPIGNNPYGLITTDLNRDGRLDLIAANSPSDSNGSISVLLGNGNGTFQPSLNTTVGTRPRYLAAGDFNRDNNQDLALTQTISDNNLRIFSAMAPEDLLARQHSQWE
jgi:uncharacterized repeat protein (TIGR02059 family)